jgi:hypothetical protein
MKKLRDLIESIRQWAYFFSIKDYVVYIAALLLLLAFVAGRYVGIQDFRTELVRVCRYGYLFTIDNNPYEYSCYNVTLSEPKR